MRAVTAFLLLMTLAVAMLPKATSAQDEEQATVTQVVGGYEASVFVDPFPAAAGAVGRIEIEVIDATTHEAVPGVTAALVITDPLDGTTSRVELTPRDDRPERFEKAGFFFARQGDWDTRLIIDGEFGQEVVELTIPAIIDTVADQIATGVDGPYRISIGANPVSPVAFLGSRFTALVLSHPEGEPVPEKSLTYRFTNPETEEELDLEATQRLDQPDFFQNLVTFLTFGTWRFVATVDGPLGTGSIEGEIVVRENTDSGISGTLLWASVMTVLVFGGIFLAWRYRNVLNKA